MWSRFKCIIAQWISNFLAHSKNNMTAIFILNRTILVTFFLTVLWNKYKPNLQECSIHQTTFLKLKWIHKDHEKLPCHYYGQYSDHLINLIRAARVRQGKQISKENPLLTNHYTLTSPLFGKISFCLIHSLLATCTYIGPHLIYQCYISVSLDDLIQLKN